MWLYGVFYQPCPLAVEPYMLLIVKTDMHRNKNQYFIAGGIKKYNSQAPFSPLILTYRRIHGTAPAYLADELLQPTDLGIRTRLRSALTTSLSVRRTRLSTVGDRAYPVAAARTSTDLPRHVTSASSLHVLRLYMHIFAK